MHGFYLGIPFSVYFFPDLAAFLERPGVPYLGFVKVPHIQACGRAHGVLFLYSGHQNSQGGSRLIRERPQEEHGQMIFRRMFLFPEIGVGCDQGIVSEFAGFFFQFAVARSFQSVRPREFRFCFPLEILF